MQKDDCKQTSSMNKRPRGFETLAIAAFSLAAASFLTIPVMAAENGTSQYSGGSSQFFAGGIPPFEGLYFLSQTNYYTASRTNDGNGDSIPIDFNVESVSEVLRFLYVSDIDIGGGTVWGQVVLPLVHVNLDIKPFIDESDFALADTTLSTGLAWHSGNSTFVGGLDVVLPTGPYDLGAPLNIGANHWSIQPVFAYKYFDPQGLDLSVSPRLIFNFENSATNYTSGTELYIDYAVGYNIGQFKLGAVGYLYQQLTDDKQNGSKVGADGHRGSAFAIGPSLTYSINPGLQFSGSWQHEFRAENRTQGESFWFNVATKF